MGAERGGEITRGMTEEQVAHILGWPPEGGAKNDADKEGPYRLLRYGKHRGGGYYELHITIRSGVVAKAVWKPLGTTSTPAPVAAQATPLGYAPAPPVMSPVPMAQAPAKNSGGGLAVGCLGGALALALAGIGLWYFLSDSEPEGRPQIGPFPTEQARPKIPPPTKR